MRPTRQISAGCLFLFCSTAVVIAGAPLSIDIVDTNPGISIEATPATQPAVAPQPTAPEPSAQPTAPEPAAQPAAEASDTTIDDLIARLKNPDYATREKASAEMLRLPTTALSRVEQALSLETDPEAASRLHAIAEHLFLKRETSLQGPVGLIGIMLNLEPVRLNPKHPDDLTMSIAVNKVQPGFPAAEVLQPGDRLVKINGQPFPLTTTVEGFRAMITGNRAGTVIPFTIIRGGRYMNVGVQLAGVPAGGNIENFVDQRTQHLADYRAAMQDSVNPTAILFPPPPDSLGDAAEQSPPAQGFRVIHQGNVIRIIPVAPAR